LKTNKEVESELINDKRTLDKRAKVKEKLMSLGKSDDNAEHILLSLERFCQIAIESIK
tara:strand:- start:7 stop:180 length:174 start_codon:yes stop_codon:yes gene_type:complete